MLTGFVSTFIYFQNSHTLFNPSLLLLIKYMQLTTGLKPQLNRYFWKQTWNTTWSSSSPVFTSIILVVGTLCSTSSLCLAAASWASFLNSSKFCKTLFSNRVIACWKGFQNCIKMGKTSLWNQSIFFLFTWFKKRIRLCRIFRLSRWLSIICTLKISFKD